MEGSIIKIKNVGVLVFQAYLLVMCGFLMKFLIVRQFILDVPSDVAWILCLMFIYLAIHIQIVFHELGHLLFGYLTGYRFMSIQFRRWLFFERDGKIQFKKLPKTGFFGQCLMYPPELDNDKMPYKLYQLGGIFANIIASVLFFGLSYLVRNDLIFGVLRSVFVVGIYMTFFNAVPLRSLQNDGSNVLNIRKSTEDLRCYRIGLLITSKIIQNIRLKDMPMEWFYIPKDINLNFQHCAWLVYCSILRNFDELNIVEARRLLIKALMHDGLADKFSIQMNLELLYCELVEENRKNVIDNLLPPEQAENLIKNNPNLTRLRIFYTYVLMVKRDVAWAISIRQQFETLAKRWPYEGEAFCEWDLMEYAWVVFLHRNEIEDDEVDVENENTDNMEDDGQMT